VPKHARPILVRRRSLRRRLTLLAGVGACLAALAAPVRADDCPADVSALDLRGAKLANLNADRVLDILAIGSSSTEGVGASSPAHAYPAVLADDLAHEKQAAAVRNAGVGGELAGTTL